MLRCSRAFASAVLLCALAASPLAARRPAVVPSADPNVLPDKLLARKTAVEALKVKVDDAVKLVRDCATTALPSDGRTALEGQLAALEVQVKDALWTYNVGNYEEAFRKYTVIERNTKPALLACDRLRAGLAACSKSVGAAIERVRGWGQKIAKLHDPTSKANCEATLATVEQALQSLDRSCATTDPAWVVRQIPATIKPLDDALRVAR